MATDNEEGVFIMSHFNTVFIIRAPYVIELDIPDFQHILSNLRCEKEPMTSTVARAVGGRALFSKRNGPGILIDYRDAHSAWEVQVYLVDDYCLSDEGDISPIHSIRGTKRKNSALGADGQPPASGSAKCLQKTMDLTQHGLYVLTQPKVASSEQDSGVRKESTLQGYDTMNTVVRRLRHSDLFIDYEEQDDRIQDLIHAQEQMVLVSKGDGGAELTLAADGR